MLRHQLYSGSHISLAYSSSYSRCCSGSALLLLQLMSVSCWLLLLRSHSTQDYCRSYCCLFSSSCLGWPCPALPSLLCLPLFASASASLYLSSCLHLCLALLLPAHCSSSLPFLALQPHVQSTFYNISL